MGYNLNNMNLTQTIYETLMQNADMGEMSEAMETATLIKSEHEDNLNVIRISTTAFDEEDFFLITDLSNLQIEEAIAPIVQRERDGGFEYDNHLLFETLQDMYPNHVVKMYSELNTLNI